MLTRVLAVHSSSNHTMSKPEQGSIALVEGFGVENDAHSGETVKHRSRVRRDSAQPNLRQVHLIQSELFEELQEKGFEVSPGMMGENITTIGIDLLSLPTGIRLQFGDSAIVEMTGLRNPCSQLDGLIPGLMEAVLDRNDAGELVRKAGVMSVVLKGGIVRPGDLISIEFPQGERRLLLAV